MKGWIKDCDNINIDKNNVLYNILGHYKYEKEINNRLFNTTHRKNTSKE